MSGTGNIKYTLSEDALRYLKELPQDYFKVDGKPADNREGLSYRQFKAVLDGYFTTPMSIRKTCAIIGVPEELWNDMIVTRRREQRKVS